MNWLFKEEPSHYNFAALVADTRAVWSGVRNPVAQKHLHAVKRGDRIFYYHTGDEKAIVGIAAAIGNAYPDPDSETGSQAVVDIKPVAALARPVTLAEIKADGRFTEFPLVRISRLSVMPVSDEEWDRIEALSKTAAAPARAKSAASARRSARR
jgi:predicted RNA-binding protein with PUA-like domain